MVIIALLQNGVSMRARFCRLPVDTAWRTYSSLYDTPSETKKMALQAYVNKLVIKGERNPDQLTVKAFQYLKKRQEKMARREAPHSAN
jgi:hypothetical protein